jgi:SPP1 family predicted phage head-tail adaptor
MTVFKSLLNHIATGKRIRRTSDGQGGWSIDYVDIGSEEVRIRPATSIERLEAMQQQREITHVMYAAYGADIARGDRWTIRDLTVEVMAVREPSRAGEHLEIDCLEEQQEVSEEEGS